jgi:hypothetical protein
MIVCEPILSLRMRPPWRDVGRCRTEEDALRLCTSGAGRKSNPPESGSQSFIAAGFYGDDEDDEAAYRPDWTEGTVVTLKECGDSVVN